MEWNSEAGRVRALKEEPQYLIKSDRASRRRMAHLKKK